VARDKSVIQVVVTGEASRLQRAMKGAGSILGTFAAIGLKAAAVTAQLAAAVGVAGVRQFANFDAAMQKSVAIMGDVSDAMLKDMSDAAREVAKTTTFSAEQAAESYFFLASAGLSAEQSIAALPKVAAFAQAGMFDMARATDLLTDAQSALGLTSDDAAENLENMTRISDVLVKANTLANASVSQFSEALTNKAGAALRVLGKDVEEGTAVLAFFADQGVKGAEAGEMLNIMLRDVTRAAAGNAKEFDKLGLSVLDSDGNLKNMADVVEEFTRVLGPMSDAQMAATLDQLGLTRAVGNSIRQTLGGADAIREYEAALRGASGATEEVAGKQLDTFNAQLGLLKSAVGDVFLSIGERLVPVFSDLVGSIQANLPAIEAFADRALDVFDRTVLPLLRQLVAFVQENVGPALVAIGRFFMQHVLPAAQETGGWFQEHLLPILKTLADFVMKNVVPAFMAIARFVRDFVVPTIRGLLEPALKGIHLGFRMVSTVVDANRDKFGAFFATLRPLFEFLRDRFAPFIGLHLHGAFALLGAVIAGVIHAIGQFLAFITRGIERLQKFVSVMGKIPAALRLGAAAAADATQGRQYGGVVLPNKAFLVGERGPELFVPMGAGRIMPEIPMVVPEVQLGNRGGSGDTYVINVSGALDAEGVARQIERVLRDSRRRTGGVLV
jgi:TP901 family phage tail tape measure protein